jgi:hypothetical protein
MSMQGSAMMYVTPSSLAPEPCELVDQRGGALDERRFHHDLVEPGRVRPLEPGAVGVIREADDRDVGPGVDDLLRLDAGDIGDDELGRSDAVTRDETVRREEPLELAPEEQVDPNEQDRCHGRDTSTPRHL